jgi:hypothetical protein
LTPAAQPASEGRKPGGMRVQRETSTGSLCRDFCGQKMRGADLPPLSNFGLLGRGLGSFRRGLCRLLCLLLRGKLLLDLGSNGVGIHLVGVGCILEYHAWIAA